MITRVHRWLGSPMLRYPLVVLALTSLISFGMLGVGRHGRGYWIDSNGDMQPHYAAGKTWLEAKNPYVLDEFIAANSGDAELRQPALKRGFSYPPQDAPFCMLLAALPLHAAMLLMSALNLIGLGALAIFSVALALRRSGVQPDDPSLFWFVPALIIGNPMTTHVLWGGQTTLIATGCLAVGWYFRRDPQKLPLSAFMLAVATLKPQVAILPMLWICAERNWRLLLWTAGFGLAFLAYPLLVNGPLVLARTWPASAQQYLSLTENVIGFQNVFGLQSLLRSAGIPAPTLWPLAFAAMAMFWAWRARIDDADMLGLLLGASLLFIYCHDYDLACLAPLLAVSWAKTQRDARAAWYVVASIVLLFVPQRFFRGQVPEVMLHWRELVLLGLWGWALADALRHKLAAEAIPQPHTYP